MEPTKVLVIPASARKGSLNRRLAAVAVNQLRAAGVAVTEYDPNELKLPVYDGDLEMASGVPDGARRLLEAIATCDALLVVTPEYNGFPTPLFINAFDWLSRISAAASRPAGLAITAGKPVALLSASPGPGGALRSMNYVRQYLQMAFQMIVVPQQFALGRALEAFDESGALQDTKASQAVAGVLGALTTLAQAISANRAGSTTRS
jgi:NAD(P)H-dependent FMN reductase